MLNLTTRFLIILQFLLPTLAFATPVQTDHATVELISEYDAIVPGQSFDLAVRFDLERFLPVVLLNDGGCIRK